MPFVSSPKFAKLLEQYKYEENQETDDECIYYNHVFRSHKQEECDRNDLSIKLSNKIHQHINHTYLRHNDLENIDSERQLSSQKSSEK